MRLTRNETESYPVARATRACAAFYGGPVASVSA